MTQQVKDSIEFAGKPFLLCDRNGSIPFSPSNYGLTPGFTTTACHRGWRANYGIQKNALVLQDLFITLQGAPGIGADKWGPSINGVQAQPSPVSLFSVLYEGLGASLDFSGGLIVVSGCLDLNRAQRLTSPFWNYEQVIELVFLRGSLISSDDMSHVAAAVRDDGWERKISSGWRTAKSRQAAKDWISSQFSLSYGFF